ncbi:MAG TPA: hypothetical protein VGR57_10505 [Ktedonobacterales bacterium]|nr:hypothetical protein [Ktedonobacterales bacterium]
MRDPRTEPDASLAGMDLAPASELEDAPPRRRTPRARLGRVALAALVCLVAGGVLLHELASVPPRPGSAPAPPGPVVLLSNVSFGSVTVNGQALGGPPPLALALADGWNRITLTAAPFAAKSCRVQWGALGWENGDCPAAGPEYASTITINGLVIQPSLVIVLRFTGADLPPRHYVDARGVIASQLAAVHGLAHPVPAGEPIAAGGHWPDDITVQSAGAGVWATMTFGLFPEGSGEPRTVQCDLALCAGSLFFTTASTSFGAVWNVAPDAYYVWRFADARGGHFVSLPYPVSPTVSVPLVYDAARGWQPLAPRVNTGFPVPIELLLDGTFCDAGIYALNALTQALGDVANVVSNNGPDGCVIALRSQGLQPLGRFIWRWGVLLAADNDASFTLPHLPVASPSEIAELGG